MKKLVLVILLISSTGLFAKPYLRPADWAIEILGTPLDNIYQVDNGIYRSEQPDDDEFKILQEFGLKEILNLRQFHSDDDEAEKTTLRLHRIKMDAGDIPEQQVVQALKIIKNRKGPILIHCWHGSDRTGTIIAAYRIIFNNWTKEKAIAELRNGGYGYHASFYPNIVTLIQNLNVNRIKATLGIM